jgi:hypothetical protein
MMGPSALAGGKPRGCVVEGRAADPLTVEVTPKGAPPFKLRVAGLPVSAAPQLGDWPAHVEVKGALQFEASAPADKLPWKTARAVDATNGMVHLAAATEVHAHANLHGKFVDVEVALGEVRLRGLTLPCGALTLDPVKAPEIGAPTEEPGESWVAVGALLHFRAAPGSGATVEAQLGADPTALDLHKSEAAGPWMRVSSHWLDGTTLVGWVQRDELKRAPPRHETLGEAFLASSGCLRAVSARPGERLAEAQIAPGTIVYATRYLGPWATVRSDRPLTVRYRAKDDWVEIVSAPGLNSTGECAEHSTVLDEAWVERKAVRIPGEAASAPDGGAPRL